MKVRLILNHLMIAIIIKLLVYAESSGDGLRRTSSLSFILKIFIFVEAFMCFVCPLFGTILKIDPLYVQFQEPFPDIPILTLTYNVARFLLLLLVAYQTCMLSMASLIFPVISTVGALNVIAKLPRRGTPSIIVVWRELQLWNQFLNANFCYYAVAPMLMFGILLLVLCNYATIRLTVMAHLSLPIYLLFPFTSCVGFVFIFALLPYSVDVFENSKDFLFRMQRRATCKLSARQLLSLRVLGVQVGNYGLVRRGLKILVIRVIMDYTINCLITF